MAERQRSILTARAVAAKNKRGRYADGGGLVLLVSKWGTKSWAFRWQRDGRERHMGLGPLHTLSLAKARERARECRLVVLGGVDPIEERKAQRMRRKIEAARGVTFKKCAEAYIDGLQAAWRNAVHRAQWGSTLAAYAYPVIGELSVSAIDTALVLKCIEPIWKIKPDTAKRVRGRLESVLDWAARATCVLAITPRGGGGISTSSCRRRTKSARSSIIRRCRVTRFRNSWRTSATGKRSPLVPLK